MMVDIVMVCMFEPTHKTATMYIQNESGSLFPILNTLFQCIHLLIIHPQVALKFQKY